MKRFGELDDPRRRILIQVLAAGVFSTTTHRRTEQSTG